MKRPHLVAALLFIATLLFYGLTLQPSLAWGDGIRLQREAITAESYIFAEMVDVPFAPDPLPFARLGVAAWDHPLYVILGHTLVRALPGLPALWLVNLLSAVFGSATIAVLFLLCARRTGSTAASLLAALALAVSHTFWWHAVTPEVYTLFTFLLIVAVYWFDAFERSGRFAYLAAAALALGLGIANHLLALLALPALLLYWLLARPPRRLYALKRSQVVWLAAAFLLGLAPYWVQFLRLLRTFPLAQVLGPAVGTTFLRGSLALSPDGLAQSAVSYLVFLVYQFLPLGLLLGLVGWWRGRSPFRPLWAKALALYLVYLLFGLVYRVSDQFAFFLGAHLFWAVAIALGVAALRTAVWPDRRRAWAAVLALPLLLTPLLYDAAPALLRAAGVTEQAFGVPQIGAGVRDGLAYYLNPNKWGDVDAYVFGRQTLAALPPEAVIIAQFYTDTDEYFVFRYLAAVEGQRPDVTMWGWSTVDPFTFDPALAREAIAAALPERPVYLASLSAAYYDAPALLAEYCIVPEHNLYRVYPAAAPGQPCLPPSTERLEP